MDLIFFNPDIFMYRSFLRCFFNHRIYKNHTVTLAVVKFVISYQNIFYSALPIPVVCIAGNVNGRHTQFTECIIFNDNRFSACNQNASGGNFAKLAVSYLNLRSEGDVFHHISICFHFLRNRFPEADNGIRKAFHLTAVSRCI